MAEIEINIMDRQCTGRRIDSKEKLTSEVMICSKERNDRHCHINGSSQDRMRIKNYPGTMLHNYN
jgi:hypothetical protein